MKKQITTIALILGVGSVILAQEPASDRNNERKPGDHPRIERMKRELTLGEEQVSKIREIHERYRPQRQSLKEGGITEDEQARFEELREAEVAEINAVLTPEQQTKFSEMEKRHRHRPDSKQKHGDSKTTPSAESNK